MPRQTQRILFRHRRIHAVPGQQPVTGLLVDGERIVAAGDATRLADDAATVVDLPGVAVIPGLHDAHLHTAGYARSLTEVDLRDADSLDEVLRRVAAHAATLPPGAPLTGGGWYADSWQQRTLPHRTQLDALLGDRPVLLSSKDEHSVWANSAMLRLAGIDAATPDPPGGSIDRDEAGQPTGILREHASRLGWDALSATYSESSQALTEAVGGALDRLLSLGLTAIHDIDGEDARAAFAALHADGRLPLRVHKAIRVEHLDAAIAEGRRSGDGDGWLSTGPVKMFADGALGSHTCDMTTDFVGDPGNSGMAVTETAELAQRAGAALDAGISVATHAIGDHAAQRVLDAYQQVLGDRGGALPPGKKLRIEHAQYLRRQDLARMAGLGVIASMQPTHCTTDFELTDQLLAGHQLVAYGWKTLLDNGIALAFGSDAPVESPDPLPGLAAAVGRVRRDGRPSGGWQPAERLTAAHAVDAYTRGPAFAAGREHELGLLQPGYLADLVALDVDPLTAGPDELYAGRAEATVVGGVLRWQR
ncbi:amidohydrolase [Nakamurella aerolata]|uniref:amidohydrolase n=1 Tax=Nakamurella aerolata TaxID=1656892 RepID=UPI001BB20519